MSVERWCQPRCLEPGWELWIGTGYVRITAVVPRGDAVLIHCADGVAYKADALDAVQCRRPLGMPRGDGE